MKQSIKTKQIIAKYDVQTNDAGIRYDVTLHLPDQTQVKVFYEIAGDVIPRSVTRADFLAVGFLTFAMHRGEDLYIDGPVSRQLLINLCEFQRAWVLWCPNLKIIKVTCREEVNDVCSTTRRAVIAFSGGVDATFALSRHMLGQPEPDRCQIVTALMVNGFDVALNNPEAFLVAQQSAQKIAAAMGVPLTTISTNWRATAHDWGNEHGSGLAACLNLFSSVADIGLIGSDEDYANFVVPWGSNPITNHFLSGESFRIVSEGGGFGRTAKVASLAAIPRVAENLRVCWEGPETGENCGVCEKCVRTKLNFMAAGKSIPLSLGAAPTMAQIIALRARNPVQVSFIVDILNSSKVTEMNSMKRMALGFCVFKNKAKNAAIGLKKLNAG